MNLINAVKLLTKQQKGGDSPVGKIVPGLLGRRRSRIMVRLRKFIAVDNHEAVKVGYLHRGTSGEAKVHKRILGSGHPGRCG